MMNKYQLPSFSESDIYKLWFLGFLNADSIRTETALDIDGISYIGDNYYGYQLYIDHKQPVLLDKYLSSFLDIPKPQKDFKLYFHPYRCFILYELATKWFRSGAVPSYLMQNADGYLKVTEQHLQRFEESLQNGNSIPVIRYLNTLVSLAAIIEPVTHYTVYEKITYTFNFTLEQTQEELSKLETKVIDLMKEIGEQYLTYFKDEFCLAAHLIDGNSNIHFLIRLMNDSERQNLKGQIAAAMQWKEASEGFRRLMEKIYEKQLPEEDGCGFSTPNERYKMQAYGNSRLLDGDRTAANLFLRDQGLDFGTKVNVYVEGDTDFSAIQSVFKYDSRVAVINLRGNFVEKNGKGLAFRESLRNDIKAQVYSFILFDGDVNDNVRAVKKAVLDGDFFGAFAQSNPDFEFGHLSLEELCTVVHHIAVRHKIYIGKEELVKASIDSKSAEQMFNSFYKLNTELSKIKKGKVWGEELADYILENYHEHETESPFVYIVKTIYNALRSSSYESDRQTNIIDLNSGRLVAK